MRPGNNVDESWNIQAGIQKKFIPLGDDHGLSASTTRVTSAPPTTAPPVWPARSVLAQDNIIGSDVDVWGLAAVQSIEAAALDLYISYRQYSADIYTAASPNGASGVG